MTYDFMTIGYSQEVSKEMTWNWNLIGREYMSFGTGSDQEKKDIDIFAQAVVDLVEAFYKSKYERWLEEDNKGKMSRSTTVQRKKMLQTMSVCPEGEDASNNEASSDPRVGQ
jgi:hypothetical protein